MSITFDSSFTNFAQNLKDDAQVVAKSKAAEQRAAHQADIDAAARLRRSANLRKANGRKPGSGPAIARVK